MMQFTGTMLAMLQIQAPGMGSNGLLCGPKLLSSLAPEVKRESLLVAGLVMLGVHGHDKDNHGQVDFRATFARPLRC